MKPLTYLINCAPEGAEAEWYQAAEESKDSEDVIAVIAYSEYQAQAKRIAELEQEKYVRDLVVISLNQVVDMRVDSLEQYLHATALNKKFIAEIESLRKQVEEIKELCAKEAEHWQKIGVNPDHACGQYIAAAIRGIKLASKDE